MEMSRLIANNAYIRRELSEKTMTKKDELEKQGFKTYENEDIQVFWNPNLCTHAGECARGNNDVFAPIRRPWVDLSQAPAAEIAAIIDRCPSKALQYELLNPFSIVFEEILDRSAAYDRGKQIGECDYDVSEGKWVISHTFVDPAYEGKGIARKLVLKVVEAARARNVRIIPACSYARRMLTESPDFQDVL